MFALLGMLAVSGVLIVYGAVSGDETLLLAGVIALLVLLIVMLAFRKRKSQKKKILEQDAHLLYWEYTEDEAEAIIARELPSIRKAAITVAVLLSICLVVILLPFALILPQEDSGCSILFFAVPVALLPLLAIPIAPAVLAGRIRRYPCFTAIGRDYAYIANRYAGINDYNKLNLENAQLLQAEPAGMSWLRVCYSYRAMRNPVTIRKTVEIPVPAGKEYEANDFVLRLGGRKE